MPRHVATGTFYAHVLPRPMRPGWKRAPVRCPAREPPAPGAGLDLFSAWPVYHRRTRSTA